MSGAFRVTVPASTANLGPGFDAFGMALALYDVVEVQVTDEGLKVEVIDAGAGGVADVPTDESHLVVRAIRRTCAHLGVDPPGLHLRCYNAIPHARGLGSSAAAVVSGVAAGYALAGREIDEFDALQLAAGFEGHADNAAASLFGGLVLAWCEGTVFHAERLTPHAGIRPVVAVPAVRSATATTRGLLLYDGAAPRRRAQRRSRRPRRARAHGETGAAAGGHRRPPAPALPRTRLPGEHGAGGHAPCTRRGRGDLRRGPDGARPDHDGNIAARGRC